MVARELVAGAAKKAGLECFHSTQQNAVELMWCGDGRTVVGREGPVFGGWNLVDFLMYLIGYL